MKRTIPLFASLAALSVSGCCVGFEPGVGFYWNREVNYGWADNVDWAGSIKSSIVGMIDDEIYGPKTAEEEQREFIDRYRPPDSRRSR